MFCTVILLWPGRRSTPRAFGTTVLTLLWESILPIPPTGSNDRRSSSLGGCSPRFRTGYFVLADARICQIRTTLRNP